ncbi:hypothetical protein Q5A_010480 [Serratia inhibens PRI-2C]|nr:hypothetical protein Q5A_010480 [Serratia inhibens PRI-2C]
MPNAQAARAAEKRISGGEWWVRVNHDGAGGAPNWSKGAACRVSGLNRVNIGPQDQAFFRQRRQLPVVKFGRPPAALACSQRDAARQ